MQNKVNFAFWGTPDVASETLEILKAGGFMPSLIITSPDRRAGRKMLVTHPPVKKWAIENNIPYMQPGKLDAEFTLKLSALHFQLLIVVAYGKIMPEYILNLAELGSINVHYSLLPKYRGASPVESAILNGDVETGVTIQQMVYSMDAGDMLAQEKTNIPPAETAPELRQRLIKLGGELLVKTLPDIIENKIKPIPQDESRATSCRKIAKEDGLIDLADDPVKNYNKFRAYAAWPRTYFFKPARSSGGKEKRIVITDAALEDGQFIIKKIIPEGGKERHYKG